MKRLLVRLTLLALALPAPAFARGEFDPTTEFEQHDWIPIHLGPLNLSITKAVVYLMIGTALTILLGEPPTADIVALRPVRCLVLPASAVQGFLLEHPKVMFRMLQSQARRLRNANRWRN